MFGQWRIAARSWIARRRIPAGGVPRRIDIERMAGLCVAGGWPYSCSPSHCTRLQCGALPSEVPQRPVRENRIPWTGSACGGRDRRDRSFRAAGSLWCNRFLRLRLWGACPFRVAPHAGLHPDSLGWLWNCGYGARWRGGAAWVREPHRSEGRDSRSRARGMAGGIPGSGDSSRFHECLVPTLVGERNAEHVHHRVVSYRVI